MYANEDLLREVVARMRGVAQAITSPHYGQVAFETKDHETDFDVVTEIDRQTEQVLEKYLAELDPGIGFHGEEYGRVRDGDIYWLVDPIDGTDAFVRGLPFCTTQLALIEEGEPTLAVVLELGGQNKFDQQVYYVAVKGNGATMGYGSRTDYNKLSVSDRGLNDGRLIFETNSRKSPQNAEVMAKLRHKTTLYQFLASGWELAQIAAGKVDGKVTLDPYGLALDYAPGALLIQEAGGVVANHGSITYEIGNFNFIATNRRIYEELVNDSELPFGS